MEAAAVGNGKADGTGQDNDCHNSVDWKADKPLNRIRKHFGDTALHTENQGQYCAYG